MDLVFVLLWKEYIFYSFYNHFTFRFMKDIGFESVIEPTFLYSVVFVSEALINFSHGAKGKKSNLIIEMPDGDNFQNFPPLDI